MAFNDLNTASTSHIWWQTQANGYGSIIFPTTSFNFVRPTHRISRNQYCFPMSVARLGGPNWNVWGSLLNDLCRQGSQSDCKHMERFLRQEKHLYNTERERQTEEQERTSEGKQQKEMEEGKSSQTCGCVHFIKPLKRSSLLSGVCWNTAPLPA